MEEVRLNGTQEFMGMNIPIVEGGFGKDCRVITSNIVSMIHDMRLDKVNDLIKNNIDEFENGIDIIDMMDNKDSLNLAKVLGFVTNNRQKHCYLLSEQGYMLLVGFMKTDKAKEIRKKMRREYFEMRNVVNNVLSAEDMAIIKVVKSKTNEEMMIAMKEYHDIVTKPLQETIEKQKPMVGLAEMRIDKKGCYSITDVTKSLDLKRGKITNWAKAKGYIHKKLQEVNKSGEKYFKVYSMDGVHNQIGITEDGLTFINENKEEIMSL